MANSGNTNREVGTVLSGAAPAQGQGTVLSGAGSAQGQGTVLSGAAPAQGQGTVLSGAAPAQGQGTVLSGAAPAQGQGTVLSGATPVGSQTMGKNWRPGLMLKQGDVVGGYTIVDFINQSGEAELYRGEKDGEEFAVKIYLNKVSLKRDVVEKLIGKQFRNLAYMVAWGEVEIEFRSGEFLKKYYEVSPFYQVVEKPLTYIQLKRMITQINEGLHELHEMGIFHKDIKPANIMRDSGRTYRIIDFGISSVAEKGQTSINNTVTGISYDYASPDARATAKAGPAEDYYSFGITIYEYFAGELPYAELGNANDRYELLNSVGIKVRESLGMPRELIKLIHGLTFYSNNPELKKKRWGYEEVKAWLEGSQELEDLDMEALPGMGESGRMATPKGNANATTQYKKSFGGFSGKQLWDSYSLADELGSHWEEGKKQVGRGYLEDFFQENGSEYVAFRSACEDTEKVMEAYEDEPEEDIAYWKLLYILEPGLKKFYCWEKKEDGRTDYTCEEMGVYLFLKPLQEKKGSEIPSIVYELLDSGLIPIYLKEQLKDEKRYQRATELIADFYGKGKEKAAWKLGYLLAGKAIFRYRNQNFEKKEELYKFIIEWTNSLSKEEALAVVRAFENTTEFQAWMEMQE